MIRVQSFKLSEVKSVMTVDPGALGGWALGTRGQDGVWRVYDCGLSRTDRGERPMMYRPDIVIVELPQHQHSDTPERTNDLFVTSIRAGMLAEATGARTWLTVTPHKWKGGAPKKIHNDRCLERMGSFELDLLNKYAKRGDGTAIAPSELNNVIDAIGILFKMTGRW